jgi:hypothetical protein
LVGNEFLPQGPQLRENLRIELRGNVLKIDAITYNQASGKLYQDGSPYLNKTFRDETEAQDYLIKMGLKLKLKSLTPLQTQASKIPA